MRHSSQNKARVLAMIDAEVHASTPLSSLTCSGENVEPKRVTFDPRVQMHLAISPKNVEIDSRGGM